MGVEAFLDSAEPRGRSVGAYDGVDLFGGPVWGNCMLMQQSSKAQDLPWVSGFITSNRE
jgi:hypothetical protein